MNAASPETRRPVLLVTGLSGAGKASILRTLEDLGFETVDNPPLQILQELVADGSAPLAIGVDARSRGFDAAELLRAVARLRDSPGIAANLIFATAEEPVLLRRFSETRRRHPLAPGGPLGSRVTEGIAREAALLAPLREAADLVVDTSEMPLPELRRQIERRFRPENASGLAIGIVSFGFPKGLPREADMVWDVRFLRNPHYDPVLRPMTGRDAPIADFVEADPTYAPFWDRMTGLIELLLPRYAAEGKKYLTVAIGCTGGRHRSVLVAERLASHLASSGWRVDLIHRDMPSSPAPGGASAGREALAHSS
ncbi:RNase adapter RapZ [Falsiroseomonas sp. HC035]|uniref:RNase adapter RapZ n=1 Tax=Falsiroseomonas sp. HC035 TaxID=3390999 RepID=UPI003D31AB35